MFQVHDSLVFDLHPSEHFLIEDFLRILMQHNNMAFRVSYSMGPNYKELHEVIDNEY
jgi:DNA polymerase I-like protein with 3'-5' exonuclease and polymerase domains